MKVVITVNGGKERGKVRDASGGLGSNRVR